MKPPNLPTYLTYLPDPRSRKFHASTKKMQKNTKNWYTIDGLGAIFAIFAMLDNFTKLLQNSYNNLLKSNLPKESTVLSNFNYSDSSNSRK